MSDRFNYGILRIARQARGLSQANLVAQSGVSQGNISKLENGLIEPTDDVLQRLADALHFPISIFFEPDRLYGLPLSVHPGAMFRKKASVGQREIEKLEAELNLRLMHVRRLLKATELANDLPLPQMDVDEFGGPEKIADTLRRTWLVPSGPIGNLMEYVERAGCMVFLCNFDDISVDGVALQTPDAPPCIFLNKAQPGDRQRFSLAHELGHIIMHRLPSTSMEDEANAFASAFLMPAGDLRPMIPDYLTIQRLAALKPVWKMSMQAILMRAKTIAAITDNQSRYLWRQISAAGYRRQEPPELEVAREAPTVIPEIVRMHIEDMKYKLADLCQLLHLREDDLRKMLPLPSQLNAPFLRVVK